MGHRDPGWKPAADYAPGSEAAHISWDNFTTEEKLMWRNSQSVSRIDDHLWAALEMVEEGAHVFLAGLM